MLTLGGGVVVENRGWGNDFGLRTNDKRVMKCKERNEIENRVGI